MDLRYKLAYIITDEAAGDLDNREGRISGLCYMADIQDVGVNSLELGAEFIRLWSLEVWRKRNSAGDGG